MRRTTIPMILAISALSLSPVLPSFDLTDSGAAFAKGGDNGGGGNGGGSGGGNGNGNAGTDRASAKAKSPEAAIEKSQKTKVKSEPAVEEVAVVDEEIGMKPNELGKMNGAMHANINAVLAHIRNGQTTNGPVGLLAGLAVADGAVTAAATEAENLQTAAAGFDLLDAALTDGALGTLEEYLAAKADGTLTPEQIAAIDPLIEAVGGLNPEGTALAETAPTPEEIQAALDAAAAAEADVASAEQAIGDAWNKDGDLEALLVMLREKLAPYQTEISAALAIPGEETILGAEIVN